MNLDELVRRFLTETEERGVDIATKLGIKPPQLSLMKKRPYKRKNRDKVICEAINFAFERGFGSDAVEAVITDTSGMTVTTLLRAALLYPDLSSEELQKIREMEEILPSDSIPAEVIKLVVEKVRSQKP